MAGTLEKMTRIKIKLTLKDIFLGHIKQVIKESTVYTKRYQEKTVNKQDLVPGPALDSRHFGENDQDKYQTHRLLQKLSQYVDKEIPPVSHFRFYILSQVMDKYSQVPGMQITQTIFFDHQI